MVLALHSSLFVTNYYTLDDKVDRKSPLQIFKDYQVKLLEVLPMNDPIFVAMLTKNNFFSGDQNAILNAQQTEATKAGNQRNDWLKTLSRYVVLYVCVRVCVCVCVC